MCLSCALDVLAKSAKEDEHNTLDSIVCTHMPRWLTRVDRGRYHTLFWKMFICHSVYALYLALFVSHWRMWCYLPWRLILIGSLCSCQRLDKVIERRCHQRQTRISLKSLEAWVLGLNFLGYYLNVVLLLWQHTETKQLIKKALNWPHGFRGLESQHSTAQHSGMAWRGLA